MVGDQIMSRGDGGPCEAPALQESDGCPGLERTLPTEWQHSRYPGVHWVWGLFSHLFSFLEEDPMAKITFPLLKLNGSPWNMLQESSARTSHALAQPLLIQCESRRHVTACLASS